MAECGKPLPQYVLTHCLKLYREGRTKAEIARLMGLSRTTVIKLCQEWDRSRL